jgi:Right handed beta helix region
MRLAIFNQSSVVLAVVMLCGPAAAAEISSNGAGGGLWSEPATWRGKVVPKADDEVVLIKGDVVVFDREDKTTCAKLSLDPESMLKFKTGIGKIILGVAGLIDSYGAIRMDASENADDHLELRLMGKKPEERTLKLHKGGSLLVMGKDKLEKNRKNVLITSFVPFEAGDPSGFVEAGPGSSLDVQNAELENIQLKPEKIDNTGTKPNERVNIVKNRFSDRSVLYATSCDTPMIADNSFEYVGPAVLQLAAIYLNSCPLAEVKNNTIRGPYYTGILGYGQTEGVTTGNVVEKCGTGIYWYGSDSMIKNCVIRNCTTGIIVTSMSGVVEEVEIDKVKIGVNVLGATVQLSTVQITNVEKDGTPINFASGELTLVNSPFGPEHVKIDGKLPGKGNPLVVAMQCLVLEVKGDAPDDTQVNVQTLNPPKPLAPGASDLNIRNNPAPLAKGFTPLPQTLSPLILKSWQIDNAGKMIPAPEYTVKVVAPGAKVLKTQNVKPDAKWFRPKPNDAAPTLEVSLK